MLTLVLCGSASGKSEYAEQLVLEAGAGQAGDIASVFAGSGWQTVGMREDLNGIKRCVILKK